MIVLELTTDEYRVLLGLMDLGVKSGGIAVATGAAVLLRKLTDGEKAAAEEAKPAKANGVVHHDHPAATQ